jgi:hypothetical protein
VLGAPAAASALDTVTRENAVPGAPQSSLPVSPVAIAGVGGLVGRVWLELRDAADDLVSFFKRLRDPSAPAPTQRQFVVAGAAATLMVFLVLAVWRPWKPAAPVISILPPPGDTGPQPGGVNPAPSGSRRQVTRMPDPPAVTPEPTAPTAIPQDRSAGTRTDSSGSRGANRETPPADSASGRRPAGAAVAAGVPAAAGASSSGASGESPPNVEAARRAIDAIIERQRRATETGNGDLLTEDLADELAEKSERQLEDLHAAIRNIVSRISNVRVEFTDATHAAVRFRAQVTGVRRSDSRPVTVYDGDVQWRLEFDQGEWLITSTSGS